MECVGRFVGILLLCYNDQTEKIPYIVFVYTHRHKIWYLTNSLNWEKNIWWGVIYTVGLGRQCGKRPPFCGFTYPFQEYWYTFFTVSNTFFEVDFFEEKNTS